MKHVMYCRVIMLSCQVGETLVDYHKYFGMV